MIPTAPAEIELMLFSFVFAMVRPGAAFIVAPVFSGPQVPLQLRILLALALAVTGVQQVGLRFAPEDVMSFRGVVLIASEALIGMAIGFSLQIGFASARMAGEAISNAMGLGFATMYDPISGQASNALSQLLFIFALLMFLALDGHLLIVAALVESYSYMRPGEGWLAMNVIESLFRLGTVLFSVALSIAFPVGFAIILVQIVMGFVSRSTPSMNLFAVGLPVSLLAGIFLLGLAMPVISESLMKAMETGIDLAFTVARG